MKPLYLASVFIFLLSIFPNVQAEEDKTLLPMLTCQESWLDWKQDPDKGKPFFDAIQLKFHPDTRENFLIPNQATSILGHNISRVYPDSVGMALGFSVVVDSSFEKLKTSLEKQMGKSFEHCDTADNTKSCEHKIGKNKTIVLMVGDEKQQSLFGCYYYYEK
jgi:hypothetical protein